MAPEYTKLEAYKSSGKRIWTNFVRLKGCETGKCRNQPRKEIDARLIAAGWFIQDKNRLNLYEFLGVAVREVNTDTGATLLIATEQLTQGSVTGMNLPSGILQQARDKAESRGLINASFEQDDLGHLSLEPIVRTDPSYIATSGFGLFFVEKMTSALNDIASTVKYDGRSLSANESGTYAPTKLRSRGIQQGFHRHYPQGLHLIKGFPRARNVVPPYEHNQPRRFL